MWINELELCPTLKPFLWIVPWDTNMRKFSISVSVFTLYFLHNSHLIVCIRLLFLLSVFNYLLVCYCSMNFKNAKGNTLYKCDICVDWIDCVVWVNFAVNFFCRVLWSIHTGLDYHLGLFWTSLESLLPPQNRWLARWHYLTTTTRIHFYFPFIFRFFNHSEVQITKALICTRKQDPEKFW